ncbi:MAG: NAD(P)H-binding protein [Erysipelotrichaceae bacterium]
MENLLITGLSGRTGRYFLNYINELGLDNYKIYATVRNEETNFTDNINKILVDLDDTENLNEITKGMDVIFHIVNIRKSINIINAAIKNNVKWVILVHTTGIYSKYKSASEEYIDIENKISNLIKNKDIKVTILRPTMIYGSLDDQNMSVFIKMVDKLRIFPVVNGGKYALQPVHQEDLGKAYYQVLINKNKTIGKNYTLSGKDPINLIDILKIISDKLNKKTKFISVPYSFSYFGAVLLKIISFKKIDLKEKVQRLVEPRAYSHDDAIKDFDYNPKPFIEGIEKEIKLYLNR